MSADSHYELDAAEAEEVDRSETGMRVLWSLLFALIFQVVETVVLALVAFELGYALIFQRVPSERVRSFANRVLAYGYRIGRYLTYNDEASPFPFADLPAALEPPEELGSRLEPHSH